ncbi:hypothetical protein ACWCQP_37145 [Streptomyces chartreusis]
MIGEIVLADDSHRALNLFAWAHDLLLEVEASYDATRALVTRGHAHVVTGEIGAGIQDLEMALAGLADVTSTRWRARCQELLGAARLGHGHVRKFDPDTVPAIAAAAPAPERNP